MKILYLVAWRLIFFAISGLAICLLPQFGDRFPYRQEILISSRLPEFLHQFANFDGVHYLGIAQSGYDRQFTQAFFPLYPLIIKAFSVFVSGNYVLAGIIVSSSFFFLSALLFDQLMIDYDLNAKVRKWSIWFYLIYPMSFFLFCLYNESLFLSLVFLTFIFYRRQKYLPAGLTGLLASATRLTGVILFFVLLGDLARKKKFQRKQLFLILIPVGLLSYMFFLVLRFGDPLFFLHAQGAFGASRSFGLLLPLATIFRYLKIFISVSAGHYEFWVAVWEFAFFLSSAFLLIKYYFSTEKKWPFSFFAGLCFLTPLFTGTLSSFPRYSLTFFPVYLVLGEIGIKPLKYAVSIIFILLNLFFFSLFARGYWVS